MQDEMEFNQLTAEGSLLEYAQPFLVVRAFLDRNAHAVLVAVLALLEAVLGLVVVIACGAAAEECTGDKRDWCGGEFNVAGGRRQRQRWKGESEEREGSEESHRVSDVAF